jgi:hypothetical protein
LIHILGFTDIPVLAELARQIAASRAERQYTTARVKMVKWFLLDWVNAKTGGSSIGREYHLVALTHPYKTGTTLPFMQLAITWTQVALHATIV